MSFSCIVLEKDAKKRHEIQMRDRESVNPRPWKGASGDMQASLVLTLRANAGPANSKETSHDMQIAAGVYWLDYKNRTEILSGGDYVGHQ